MVTTELRKVSIWNRHTLSAKTRAQPNDYQEPCTFLQLKSILPYILSTGTFQPPTSIMFFCA